MGPSQEEPAQVPPEWVTPDPVPGPSQPDTSVPEDTSEDLVPRGVTFQDVRDYLAVAGEDQRALIRAELAPDTREAGNQATLLPAPRSYPTQTPPPSFIMSQNPDGSVTREHASIHIRILDTFTHQE